MNEQKVSNLSEAAVFADEYVLTHRTVFWCAASEVTTFEGLQELILLEDFKGCLPESLVLHLNQQLRSDT